MGEGRSKEYVRAHQNEKATRSSRGELLERRWVLWLAWLRGVRSRLSLLRMRFWRVVCPRSIYETKGWEVSDEIGREQRGRGSKGTHEFSEHDR